jgi:hypothetical protein
MLAPTIIELVYLVAIAHVWARGSIFRVLRKRGPRLWVMLADCPLCSGFWIGVIGHFFVPANVIYFLGVGSIVGTCALATCALIRRL